MHILIAEDDVRLARVLRRVLQEDGHVVDVASDGRQALELGSERGVELIILDVMLPEMDGFEVCRALRSAGVDTPILMLTARSAVDDRVRGLDAGADDYLVKPFALAELQARVRALTRRAPSLTEQSLKVADLSLDVSRHSAVRGGKEIPLSVKEFQLLEFFMRHPNQVLSRTQILDSVWQYDRAFTSNVVDIYVHYLRNKIDRGFPRRLLHTIRGVGYMLRA
ncbi:MAG TPA: response regulator transcription factor [Dehalococcoidia bacterium]|nr:response regulator transcription factor [Dehalococcoidia bacterium]